MSSNNTLFRLVRLIFGLFVFAFGLMVVKNGNLGMSAWNTLNDGIIRHLPISFGQANISISVIIVTISYLAKEKIGLGTVLNMVSVGTFMDLIENFNLIPEADNFFVGVIMIFVGMIINAFGTCMYLGAGFGAGPRDGLMLFSMRVSGQPLGKCRIAIEGTVFVIAVLLGAQYGVGTVITAFCNGPLMQFIFKQINFKPKELKHQYLF